MNVNPFTTRFQCWHWGTTHAIATHFHSKILTGRGDLMKCLLPAPATRNVPAKSKQNQILDKNGLSFMEPVLTMELYCASVICMTCPPWYMISVIRYVYYKYVCMYVCMYVCENKYFNRYELDRIVLSHWTLNVLWFQCSWAVMLQIGYGATVNQHIHDSNHTHSLTSESTAPYY